MPQIIRYPIEPKVAMPCGATVVKIAYDPADQKVCLWALVDPKAPLQHRYFATVKSNEELPDYIEDCRHLETLVVWQMAPNGGSTSAVAHVFEVPQYLALKHGS